MGCGLPCQDDARAYLKEHHKSLEKKMLQRRKHEAHQDGRCGGHKGRFSLPLRSRSSSNVFSDTKGTSSTSDDVGHTASGGSTVQHTEDYAKAFNNMENAFGLPLSYGLRGSPISGASCVVIW